MSGARFEFHRERLIERLTALVERDERLLALWLQGSLADGTADPLSDVDAYLAVRDEDFAEVYAARLEIARLLGDVLAYAESEGLRAVHCLLAGPVKLDLFFEPAAGTGHRMRPAVRLLVDKAGVGSALRTGWVSGRDDAIRAVESAFRGAFQGAAWPLRLLAREQWTTLAASELFLVNDTLVLLMAVQHDLGNVSRNRLSLPRHLPMHQRRQVEALGALLLQAHAARDPEAMLDAHLRVLDAILSEGRAAYAALGTGYPLRPEAEAAIRDLYVREWSRSLPP